MTIDKLYKDTEQMILEILKSKKLTILQDVVDLIYNIFDKYDWVGIYFVKYNSLFLGPWKGKQATDHIKIPIGEGICGSAAESGKTELINNVKNDNRYLACFINTKSEIVVPIKKYNKVIGEIDIDSDSENSFDTKDKEFLENIVSNQLFIDNMLYFIDKNS